jgi:ABC-type branched-chain amino acid transport system, permease component
MSPSYVSGRAFAGIGGLGLLGLAPVALSKYYLGVLTLALIYAIFALSLDLAWGYAGILTFGHAVFFGTGAYIMAVLLPEYPVVGGLTATVVAGAIGVVVAGPLLYRGVEAEYFALITLAFGVIAEQVATSWTDVTGGSNGLLVRADSLSRAGVSVELSTMTVYAVVVGAVIGTYAIVRRVVNSSFGAAVIGIAQNEQKARALGYDVARYRTMLFGVSGAIAGGSGALYTVYSGFVSPSLLGFELSTTALIWVLVGGRGTLTGAVVGAVGITLFENILSGVFVFAWTLILGLTLVAVVVALPGGLVGATTRLRAWLEEPIRWLSRQSARRRS